MKKTLLLLFFFCCSILQAQNLVPNPSFEDFSSCPNDECQIYKATGWSSFGYTPDYFNSCSLMDWSVPFNVAGYQNASTGNAYAAIGSDVGVYGSFRDYIGIELATPLVIGKKYYVNFNVSLANGSHYGIDKIGVLFTTVSYEILPYNCSNPLSIFFPKNFSHVYSNNIITDTVNWTMITGSFIADSAYSYLMIGNFFDDTHSNHVNVNLGGNLWSSYYYIDDVYVSTDSISSIFENSINSPSITIFPNPIFNKATINIDKYKTCNLKILDVFGRVMKEIRIENSITEVTLDNLNSGVYFFLFEFDESNIIKAIIKTN